MNNTNIVAYSDYRQGMAMRYSKGTIDTAVWIVDLHGKYDSFSRQFGVDLNTVPDHLIADLCRCIMLDDPALAREAISVDNDAFDKIMMPSLLSHLFNISNPEKLHDFKTSWQKGIFLYLHDRIVQLIAEIIDEQKYEMKRYV